MRATRAYIASAGTAVVMLGASLAMLVLVSGFVAFGSWPGANSATKLDQVVLRDAAKTAKARPVAVNSNAVVIARRVEQRRALAVAQRRQTQTVARVPAGTPVAQAPTQTGTAAPQLPAGTPIAQAPTTQVQKQAQNVGTNLNKTTQDVTQQVTQGVQNVTNQVNEVVDQVIGPQSPAGETVQKVTDGAGSLLGG